MQPSVECSQTSGADIRAKATATAAGARRCPASAQRGILGAPRSAHCRMPAHPPRPKAPDPIEPDAPGAFEAPRGGHGARRLEVALERAGLACVRAGGPRCYARLPVDLCNRETAGCSRGRRKDARLVKAAFSNAAFPLAAIEAFRSDRGPEFCNGDADAPLSAFGIERSASRPGNPCDNAVAESTSRVLEREPVRGRAFPSEDRPRTGLFDWVNWHNDCRLHSTLGCMAPAGFREAGLILS